MKKYVLAKQTNIEPGTGPFFWNSANGWGDLVDADMYADPTDEEHELAFEFGQIYIEFPTSKRTPAEEQADEIFRQGGTDLTDWQYQWLADIEQEGIVYGLRDYIIRFFEQMGAM